MYAEVLQLVSCLQISSLKPCIHFTSVLYMTHPSPPHDLITLIIFEYKQQSCSLWIFSAPFYFLSFRLKFSTVACSWMPSVNIFSPCEEQSFTLTQNNRQNYRFVHLNCTFVHLNLCFQIADLKKKYSEQNCVLLVMTAWHKHKFVSWRSNDVT
jgi:hypothetical protein